MRPTLQHKPSHYTYKDLLVKFADGKPLSCDQLNFLYQHEKALSHPHLDPVMKYYLKHYHHDYISDHSFLMPADAINAASASTLKERLLLLLANQAIDVTLRFTPEQFHLLKEVTYPELILYHGNQFLSGAPFHPGGIPHLIYFQWGNLFGVAKYVVMAEERALKTNVLIYFEDRCERLIADCVAQYQEQKLKLSVNPLNEKPALQYHSPFTIPTLTYSKSTQGNEETK